MNKSIDKLTWEYTALGKIMGYKVTSKINGDYIFFLIYATKESINYWDSMPGASRYHDTVESLSIIIATSVKRVGTFTSIGRWTGCPIRPVTK